ncbi:MAG: twin-arginine translocase TatA/TatE family subunit [Nitrospinae bacterium]|nr:twin-arginine translocase TatA/TatE family subunit [Nitrospinota bacterium]
MFGIGMPELLVILAIALVVLGPDRIPEVARTLGKLYAELTRSMRDMRSSVPDLGREFREGAETIRHPVKAVGRKMAESLLDEEEPKASPGDEGGEPKE